MLPAGILDFMLLGDPEEGFSADPPIQRSKDVSCLMRASKAALRFCRQAATGEAWFKTAKQSFSPTGMRVAVI